MPAEVSAAAKVVVTKIKRILKPIYSEFGLAGSAYESVALQVASHIHNVTGRNVQVTIRPSRNLFEATIHLIPRSKRVLRKRRKE